MVPSYFNGFSTSQQESVYNTVTSKLVSILGSKCFNMMSTQVHEASPANALSPIDESNADTFAMKILKLHKVLR